MWENKEWERMEETFKRERDRNLKGEEKVKETLRCKRNKVKV